MSRSHPRRLAAIVAAIVAAGLLLPAALTVAQPPDRIELPDGWAPEGVTALDGRLFIGSLANGAIWSVDPITGEGSVFVKGKDGRVAVGVEAEPANGRLWVAGGRTGQVRAYDAETGKRLQTYKFKAGFLNDAAATPDAIYFTDSFMPQLAVVPLKTDGGLRKPGQARTIPITGDLVYEEGRFNANGIVAAPNGLVGVR